MAARGTKRAVFVSSPSVAARDCICGSPACASQQNGARLKVRRNGRTYCRMAQGACTTRLFEIAECVKTANTILDSTGETETRICSNNLSRFVGWQSLDGAAWFVGWNMAREVHILK